MKKLILIDSHALIHRAYHALPPLSSASGEPLNAVYGFSSILLRILRELKPDYIAAAFDTSAPTFRHVAYERYKAQRPETPDDLSGQFAKAKEIAEAFGIPVFEKPGFEADDLIGTMVKKAGKIKNMEIIIVTGDMDSLQLVGPRVRVYTLKKGITETAVYDEKAVQERYGLKPKQMIDFKGLKGDPSDNIKGVMGIGEKTATELIKNFGSIEGTYRALKKNDKRISASVAEKLRSGEEDAYASKELARLKTDVSIDFSLEKAAWQENGDKEKIRLAFQKFGFHSLLKRLGVEVSGLNEPKAVSKPEQATLLGLSTKNEESGKKDGLIPAEQKRVLSDFLLKKVEIPLTGILREMEKRGILLNVEFLRHLSAQTSRKINGLEQEIYKIANGTFNINSTRELSRVLFEKLKIPTKGLRRTEKNKVISTGASELEKLKNQHPLIQKILDYRELAKLQNTYIDALPKLVNPATKRIHTTFNQFGAATGRLSSSNPNLQNTPIMSEYGRQIRRAFMASSGFSLVGLDYSQIELRVAAHLSDDQKMIEAFRRGDDIHRLTAAEINNIKESEVTPELRREAKTLNFGVLYGMGSQAFAEATGLPKDRAKKFIEEYFQDFSGVREYIENTKRLAFERGWVETMFGRKRYIPEISSSSWALKREGERMAVNMPVQGSAADLIKMAMVKIDFWLKKNKLQNSVKMLLQVHDELIFEIKEEIVKDIAPKIKDIMENVAELKVPLIAEYKTGKNWGEI